MEEGFYWFTSERASYKAIGQYMGGVWHLIGESEPVPMEVITERGWTVGERIAGQDVEETA